jgi:hypothetical protein
LITEELIAELAEKRLAKPPKAHYATRGRVYLDAAVEAEIRALEQNIVQVLSAAHGVRATHALEEALLAAERAARTRSENVATPTAPPDVPDASAEVSRLTGEIAELKAQLDRHAIHRRFFSLALAFGLFSQERCCFRG